MMLLIDPSGKSLGLVGNRSPRHTTSRSHKAALTSSIIVGPEKQAASEVHGLLLEAHPHADDANLARAAEITSSSMIAHDDFRANVFLTIQRLQKAIADGASASEAEDLLLDAKSAAERLVRAAR